MSYGNGGSAADAQHLSSELLNRYARERRELVGIARPEDLLMVITTSGNSSNLLKAVAVADQKSVRCIALNGKGGDKLNDKLDDNDIDIVVEGNLTARIQEVHGLIIHFFCELLDSYFLIDNRVLD
ncbi:MAG: hypothetical protein AAF197_07780 [Pseudomonadota bacterium]